jgi:hypothetical protein
MLYRNQPSAAIYPTRYEKAAWLGQLPIHSPEATAHGINLVERLLGAVYWLARAAKPAISTSAKAPDRRVNANLVVPVLDDLLFEYIRRGLITYDAEEERFTFGGTTNRRINRQTDCP